MKGSWGSEHNQLNNSMCQISPSGIPVPLVSFHMKGLFQRMASTIRTSAVVAVVTAALISFDADLEHDHGASISLRIVCMLLSLCQVILVLRYHYYRMRVLMRQGKVVAISPWAGVWAQARAYVLIEALLNCLFVPPRLDGLVKYYQLGTYSYFAAEDFIMPFMFFRLYHCFRWGLYMSQFATSRTFLYM